jgi:hypothetical protein
MIFNGKCQINENNTMLPEGNYTAEAEYEDAIEEQGSPLMAMMRMTRIDTCDIGIILK